MRRVAIFLLFALPLLAVAATAHLYYRHTQLSAQYAEMLEKFRKPIYACADPYADGSAMREYQAAFDALPLTEDEYEWWEAFMVAPTMEMLNHPPKGSLFETSGRLGMLDHAQPATTQAPKEVLSCLGLTDTPSAATDAVVRNIDISFCEQLNSLKQSQERANAASLLPTCQSPYSPLNNWAIEGDPKPPYGFMTFINLNRLHGHLAELRGSFHEAARLYLTSVRMIGDLQRDAVWAEYLAADVYLEVNLKLLQGLIAFLDAAERKELLEASLDLEENWPSLHRSRTASVLVSIPFSTLPGIELDPAAGFLPYEFSLSNKFLLLYALPAYPQALHELTHAYKAPSLIDVMEHWTEWFGALRWKNPAAWVYIFEITSPGYDARHRINLSLLRLLQLQLADSIGQAEDSNLVDPVTGEPFRITRTGSVTRYSSAATEEAFRAVIAEHRKRIADELLMLDFTSPRTPQMGRDSGTQP